MDENTVVVTGGTGGIGRAVTAAFVEAGATVVIGARGSDALEDTVSALGSAVEGVRTDVRDEYDVERLFERASKAGPRSGVDVVAACAGVYHGTPGATPTDEESYDAFDDHWRTNARGVFTTIREALPHATENARILVPTGAVARNATAGYGSYAISKAGAEAIVRGFSVDTDVVVGCLEPGQIATALTDWTGREPESIAAMFVWAATDADPATIDGTTVGLREWKQATR